MYSRLRKLFNNVLSLNALRVLGPAQFVAYLGTFIVKLSKILAARDLTPLDEAMSGRTRRFNYRGQSVVFDVAFCDQTVKDGSFAFGSVRELYIRDCYFKHLPHGTYENAKVALDLGANRGSFSALMAAHVEKLVSVEASSHFLPVIEHNVRANGVAEPRILIGFIGAGGLLENAQFKHWTIEEVLDQNQIDRVDVLKMDIEGSEYALLADASRWLPRVDALTMEVHSPYGDTGAILEQLAKHGFRHVIANEDLEPVDNPRDASFVYAWRAD